MQSKLLAFFLKTVANYQTAPELYLIYTFFHCSHIYLKSHTGAINKINYGSVPLTVAKSVQWTTLQKEQHINSVQPSLVLLLKPLFTLLFIAKMDLESLTEKHYFN